MIKDYDNDIKMAELGRRTAKQQAIRKAQQEMRDTFMAFTSTNDVDVAVSLQAKFIKASGELIEHLDASHDTTN